jgi:hypothetical protein
VTFAEIAHGLASIDVSGRDPEWLADWAELIEMIRRAGLQKTAVGDGKPRPARVGAAAERG